MPKVIKKKIIKKGSGQVEDDEVKSTALKALEAARERQKHIIAGVAAAAVVIISLITISAYSSSVSRKAYAKEQEAFKYFYSINVDETMTEKERWTRALELYKESVNIKASPSSLYYLGNCYFNLGDYENAIKEYTRFTGEFSGNSHIASLVYQKLASSYFRTGQTDKALEALNMLGKVNRGIFRDTALVFEARHYESAGESEKAISKYNEIISSFPTSPWIAEASSRVAADEAKKAKETGADSGDGAANKESADKADVPAGK